jgi:hypothetical protein
VGRPAAPLGLAGYWRVSSSFRGRAHYTAMAAVADKGSGGRGGDGGRFTYVRIPADDSEAVQELHAGWVADTDTLPEHLAATFGETDETGSSSSVEQFVLLRPANQEHDLFVYAYGGPALLHGGGGGGGGLGEDGEAQATAATAPPNRRATALAAEVGFHNTRFYGDVFISRLQRPPGARWLWRAPAGRCTAAGCWLRSVWVVTRLLCRRAATPPPPPPPGPRPF